MMAHKSDDDDMDDSVVVTITNHNKNVCKQSSRNKSRRQYRYQQRRNSNNNSNNNNKERVRYETLVQQGEQDQQQSNTSSYKQQQQVLQYRPRIIYFSIFTIYAISNGRFLALFLQKDGKLNNSEIGIVYSMKLLLSLPLTTYGGYYADTMEKYYPGYGRIYIILIGISFAMILFILHGLSRIISSIQFFTSLYWFLILQIGMGISTSILSPVLDGLCLDYLKSEYYSCQHQSSNVNELNINELDCNKSDTFQQPDATTGTNTTATTTTKLDEDKKESNNDTDDPIFENINNTNTNEKIKIINHHQQRTSTSTDNNNKNNNQQQFGKERVFGAYSWAITNVILSLLFDYYSNDPFIVTYPLCILSSIATMATIYIYCTSATTTTHVSIHKNSSYIPLSNNSTHGDKSENGIIDNNNIIQKQQNISINDHNDEESSNIQLILMCNDNQDPTKQKIAAIQTDTNDCIHKCKIVNDESSTNLDESDTCTSNDDDDDDDNNTMIQNDTNITYNDDTQNYGTDKQKTNTIDNNLSLPQLVYIVMSSSVLAIPFSIAFVTLSSGQAIVDSLVFLYFKELGSSYTIMGLTVVLTVLFEIPIFHIAPLLLQKVGSSTLLLIASFCYIIRVIGYTFIQSNHIYYLLLLEPFHGITYACSATAAVDYISKIIPNGYEASGQSILYLLKSIGTITGVFFGGIVQDMYGPIIMYRLAACVVTSGSLIFIFAHIIYNRKLIKKNSMVCISLGL